jgi:hypothetical protein
LIAGLVFGALDIGLMMPMSFPDKTTALLGADAIITHKYIPILVLGGIGGLIIGGLIHGWRVNI